MDRRMCRWARRVAFALAALSGAAQLACGPTPFEAIVRFPGAVAIEPEAPVVYRGVEVGQVVDVALHQASPRESARVAVRIRIEDPAVVLREGDRFEISSGGILGTTHVLVSPAEGEADPLVAGAVVEGVAPAVTRVRESMADALETLTDAAAEAADEVAAELSRSFGILSYDGPPPSQEDFEEEYGEGSAPPGGEPESPDAPVEAPPSVPATP